MTALPVFLPLSEAARKYGQFAAQMGVEVGMQGAVIIEDLFGEGRPEEEKGKVNAVGDGVEPFGELLTKWLGLLALPPEPQDEPDAIIPPILPQGIIGRNGEMAEEKVAIQQQAADGGKGQRQADLCGGGVGMSDQVCWGNAAAVGRVEILCADKPIGKRGDALC
jgi:hypothetical protein